MLCSGVAFSEDLKVLNSVAEVVERCLEVVFLVEGLLSLLSIVETTLDFENSSVLVAG